MRTIQCKRCGVEIQVDGETAYCDACRLAIKRESVFRERICPTCGVHFMGYPKSKYCPDCQRERNRISDRDCHRRKSRGKSRVIGQEYPCAKCGKPFTMTGGTQKYCPECAHSASMEVIRAHKRDYARENSEAYRDGKVRRHTDRTVCVICGKAFTSDRSNVTCSRECAVELLNRNHRKYYRMKHPVKQKPTKADYDRQSEWLTEIRKKLNITQKEAAQIIGVTLSTWNYWERGVFLMTAQNRERVERMLEQEVQSEANVKEILE